MINFTENKGVWFHFDEENQDLGGICLRMPTADDYDEIEELTVKEGKPDYHRGVRYPTKKTNEKLATRLQSRKLIVDWKGVSLEGTKVECTNENIDRALKIQDFHSFVGDCIEKLLEGNKTIEAARLKNFENSPNGDSVKEEDSAETNA